MGQAANTDTLVVSADAYLNALNKLIIKRKTAPDPMDFAVLTIKGERWHYLNH